MPLRRPACEGRTDFGVSGPEQSNRGVLEDADQQPHVDFLRLGRRGGVMRILLATDGSATARDAACALAGFCLPPDSKVVAVAVLPAGSEEDGSCQFVPVLDALGGQGIAIETDVRYGVPAEEILRAEEAHQPDLLVLGSRGLSSVTRFWLGSVAERVAQYSRTSVLLVRPGYTRFQTILVGLDRSPLGERIATWLGRFPPSLPAEIHLATFITLLDVFSRLRRMWLPPAPAILRLVERMESVEAERELKTWGRRLTAAGATPRTHVRVGAPAPGLLQLTEELAADLLVVGSHGRGLLALLILASASDQVLAEAPCSLLIVKPSQPGPAINED